MRHDVNTLLSKMLLNIDSSRYRQPSLHSLNEGWTEVWGVDEHHHSLPDDDNDDADDKPRLILVQFEVAFGEQLLLRAAKVPHTVKNSHFSLAEATGPLPYLSDLSLDNNTEAGALVGRHQPGCVGVKKNLQSNDIFTYLRENNYTSHLESHLTSLQRSQKTLFGTLLTETLNPLLSILLHCHNGESEKQRAIAAATTPPCDNAKWISLWRRWWHPLASFQYWALGEVTLRDCQHHFSKEIASYAACCDSMKEAYTALNQALLQLEEKKDEYCCLLGGKMVTEVDALLFDHVARACRDGTIFLLLQKEFSGIWRFYNGLREDYFVNDCDNDEMLRVSSPWRWRLWKNDEVNRHNPYCNLTTPTPTMPLSAEMSRFYPPSRSRVAGEMIHRVRHGGDFFPPPTEHEGFDCFHGMFSSRGKGNRKKEEDNKMIKLKRESQHYDTLWMGFVLAGVGLVFVTSNRVAGQN